MKIAPPIALLCLASFAIAQAPPKKVLTHKDSEIWNGEPIGMTLSRDGQWVAYTNNPPEGDRTFVVKQTFGGKEYRFPVAGRPANESETPAAPGATPPPAPGTPPALPGGFGRGSFIAGSPAFTPDGKKLITTLTPGKAEIDKAKEAKAEAPKATIVVIDLATGTIVERIASTKSYRIVGDSPGYLFLHREAKPEPKAEPKAEEKPKETTPPPKPKPKPDDEIDDDQPPAGRTGRGQRPGGTAPGTTAPTTGTPTPRRSYGTDLVVRNLADGKEAVYADVVDFQVTKDVKHLIATTAKKDAESTVSVAELGKGTPLTPIRKGNQRFSQLTFNAKQTQLIFFADDLPAEKKAEPADGDKKESAAPTPAPTPKSPTVYLWDRGSGEAKAIITPETTGLKKGMRLSDRTLGFTRDGKKLSLTAVPVPGEPEKPSTIAPADKVDLDLWHWKDEKIQPMQKVQAAIDRNKSYTAVFFLDTNTLVQTSDESRTVGTPSHGDWGIGSDDRKYRYLTGYGASLRDYAFVNIRTGEAKPIATASAYGLSLSPTAKIALQFDGKDWWSIAVGTGERRNLTATIPAKFFDDELDTPSEPTPTGFPQWVKGEKHLVIPDKHDLWKVAIDGSSATKLTGRRTVVNTRFRFVPLDSADDDRDDEPGLDLDKPHLLAATNLDTFDTGFYRYEPGKPVELISMAKRAYGTPVKAKNADVLLLRSQTFAEPNDYYVTTSAFGEMRKITDIQPRVKEFNWGKAEIVNYTSDDGVKLKGMLIKPENFDPNKQYPMIVYIYEKLSNNLHQFRLPTAGTSINPTYYASNGYLVFMPDIVYTIGSPGQSALKCVLPAIQAVVNRGIVKEDAIGIQGHSWGGYQIAYMITQTNRFKAASAGAPVSNMVSAYGGIRWGTGLPREFQYERTQSRIGATLWAAPTKFIENSPIFYADRVKTPLIMLHNDQDDAVPWYQGIEYYLALRRLGKEVYLFNYNGEFHGLRKKATQRDYTLRMQQFFDHHLKGAPAPEWMAKGIPYLDRDKEKEQWKGTFTTEKK